MRKILGITMILFVLAGCAAPLQWTPGAKTALAEWGTWADKWVGGALKAAPSIIAGVSALTGETPETKAASAALMAATAALGSYHAVVAVGSSDPTVAQANLIVAIDAIKDTVGKVKDTAAVLQVPTPSPAP